MKLPYENHHAAYNQNFTKALVHSKRSNIITHIQYNQGATLSLYASAVNTTEELAQPKH